MAEVIEDTAGKTRDLPIEKRRWKSRLGRGREFRERTGVVAKGS